MTSIAVNPSGADWLRGRSFDLAFIVGVAALAIASGAAVAANPALFPVVLFVDLWLLGYHHVISTFTRIAFDRESFRQNRFLVLGLPPLVIAGTVLLAWGLGFWAIASLYLYWQWFHYSRQSFGVAQAYRRKANGMVAEDGWTFQAIFYLLPLWGILHRSAQAPGFFLGMQLRTFPVPPVVVDVVGVAALAALAYWLVLKVAAWRAGRLPVAHTLFMLSHFAVFYIGYIVIDSIDHGWLVLNVWHNVQYIMFVWLFNNNRFRTGIDPQRKLLSTLSQTSHVARYMGVCFVLSTVLYLLLENAVLVIGTSVVAYVALAYQVINFHHYIVDGIIWRRRKIAATQGAPQPQPAAT